MTDDEQSDEAPWWADFNDLMDDLLSAATSGVGDWPTGENVSPEDVLEFSLSVDVSQSRMAIRATLREIDAWFNDWAETIFEHYHIRRKGAVVERAWLENIVKPEFESVCVKLDIAKKASINFAELINHYSGFGGLVRGFVRGAANPLDAIASVFGGGTLNQEFQRLQRDFNVAWSEFFSQVDEFMERVEDEVDKEWEDSVLGQLPDE